MLWALWLKKGLQTGRHTMLTSKLELWWADLGLLSHGCLAWAAAVLMGGPGGVRPTRCCFETSQRMIVVTDAGRLRQTRPCTEISDMSHAEGGGPPPPPGCVPLGFAA
jgi:hypothetical protein